MERRYEVSRLQRGLWLDRQLNPESSCYNIPVLAEADGVEPMRLAGALAGIVRRHAILRTRFELQDNKLMAVELETCAPAFTLVDFGHLQPAAAEAACLEHAAAVARQPFSPSAPPLFSVRLIRLGGARFRLLIVADQLVLDGMSIWKLATSLLEKPVRGSSRDGEGGLEFRDYVAAQQGEEWRRSFAASRRYWAEELRDMPRSLALPYDTALAEAGDAAGASLVVIIPQELAASVRELARAGGATRYTVLLAVFALHLARITAQRDLVIAVPVAGRNSARHRHLLGPFVNVVPLCLRVDEEASPAELITHVKDRLRGALRHSSCPLDVLAEDLGCRSARGRTPFTSVSFNGLTFVDRNLAPLAFASFKDNFGIDQKMDLNCYVVEAPGRILMRLDYRKSLFRRETAELLQAKLLGLLRVAARHPARPWRELSSGVAAPAPAASGDAPWYGDAKSVVDVFYRQARQHGKRFAVRTAGATLTYATANRASNRLARHLLRRLQGGERVGLLLRQEAVTVPILALLKSGNPYVPLDPAYPEERLRHLVAAAALRVVLTDSAEQECASRLGDAVEVLGLEDLAAASAGESDSDVLGAVTPETIAYILFTSGSTGAPKGVAQTHRAILHFISCYAASAGLSCGDRLSGLSSVCFDAFNNDFYGALLSGASYHPLSSREELRPDRLCEWLERHGITVWHSVPGLLRHAAGEWIDRGVRFPELRLVKLSGELIRPADLALAAKIAGQGARFVVSLGSTESTYSLANVLDRDNDEHGPSIPVGRPVSRTEVQVRADDGRACEALEPGVLFVYSDFLPAGYVGGDSRSRETFVAIDGCTWYRTGDIVRRLANGSYRVLGRDDAQVKVGGCRIELGEVEQALAGHAAVAEAVVTAEESASGDRCLVAYYTTRHGCPPQELRARLAGLLPPYMIPARFVEVAALPRTPSGKVDRRSLAETPPLRAGERDAASRAGDELETRLAELCRNLLGAAQVGVDDDFFMIGGHSLLAMRLVQRLESDLGIHAELQDVFAGRSAAGIAARVRGRASAPMPPALPAGKQQHYAASPGQQRLWAVCELEGGSIAYNMSGVYRIRGAADPRRLRRAFVRVVDRYEALRTTFAVVDGCLRGQVQPAAGLDFAGERLCELAEAERWEKVRSEMRHCFDLRAGPLFRVRFYEWAERESVLLVSVHHIVCDGWSVNVLIDEVAGEYRGDPAVRAEVASQRDRAGACAPLAWSSAGNDRRGYWLEELRNLPPPLELPSRRARPARRTFSGATVRERLAGEAWREFRRLCAGRRATPMAGLLAALGVLFYRTANESDVVIGVPWAGRASPGLERRIGFYVQVLPVRMRLQADDAFGDVLDRAAGQLERAQEHAQYHVDLLLGEALAGPGPSQSSVFNVILVERETYSVRRAFAGVPDLDVEEVPFHPGTAKYDLSFYAAPREEACELEVEYNTDLFERAQIERLLGHLAVGIAAASRAPRARVVRLPLLTGAEAAKLEAVRGPCRPPPAATIVEMLGTQAAATPDAVALVFGDAQWSYRAVNLWSRKLSGYLQRRHGVEPGDRVGIMLERSERLLLSILAVLKTGAAYVPLDPAYPGARIEHILADSRATHVIGSEALLARKGMLSVRPAGGRKLVVLDVEWERVARHRAGPATLRLGPENPAYIIYTSGSTGRPKGVVITHANAVNLLAWAWAAFGRDELSRMLASTSVCFDLSVFELLVPLAGGGAVVLVGGIFDLRERRRRADLTFVNTVPSAAALCVSQDLLPPGPLTIGLAGEPLSPALARVILRRDGVRGLHNLYAPTETTTYSTHEVVGGDRPPTIGRPIDNTSVHVLDAQLNRVPIGVSGEIYIGGRGVTAGYWGDPERTALAFVPSPFAPDLRVYRTGDRGTILEDGNIEFHGRRDDQVKIRGFRIELGEVEANLAEHPQVEEAAVVAVRREDGEYCLVAYYVARTDIERRELMEWQAAALPEPMIPSFHVRVAALPRTPNGKLDRAGLPPADASPLALPTFDEPPRGILQERLLSLWRDVLGELGTPGGGMNFFELGGNSLKLMKLAFRLQQELGVELTLPQLFASASLPAMDALVRGAAPAGGAGIGHAPDRPDYELTSAQRRIWVASQAPDGSVAHNIAGAYRLTGPLEPGALARALERVVARHEALRTVFFSGAGGVPRQRILDSVQVPLLRTRAPGEDEAIRLAELDARGCFDLPQGPLLRARLVRLGERVHVLCVVVHHLVCDGWSLEILMRELLILYRAFLGGAEDPLPPPRLRYRDFIEWRQGHGESQEASRARDYWRDRLAGELPVLRLPRTPSPGSPFFAGRDETLLLDRGLIGRLRRIGEENDATLSMVLLAALNALFHRYTGQTEIVIGVPVAGRAHIDLVDVVGLLVNLLPIRTELQEAQAFTELLATVRRHVIDGLAHQDYAYDDIVAAVRNRHPARRDLFDVAVAMLDFTGLEAVSIAPGLEARRLALAGVTSRFDLSIFCTAMPEGLSVRLEYRAAAFSAATIATMARRYKGILMEIAADPGRALRDLRISEPGPLPALGHQRN